MIVSQAHEATFNISTNFLIAYHLPDPYVQKAGPIQ